MQVEHATLPGIGLLNVLTTTDGMRVGVVQHRSGHRELVFYDASDSDTVRSRVPLTATESRAVGDLLGTPVVTAHINNIEGTPDGPVCAQVLITSGSPFEGRPLPAAISETAAIAILRETAVIAGPGREVLLRPSDVVVVVGSMEEALQAVEILSRRRT